MNHPQALNHFLKVNCPSKNILQGQQPPPQLLPAFPCPHLSSISLFSDTLPNPATFPLRDRGTGPLLPWKPRTLPSALAGRRKTLTGRELTYFPPSSKKAGGGGFKLRRLRSARARRGRQGREIPVGSREARAGARGSSQRSSVEGGGEARRQKLRRRTPLPLVRRAEVTELGEGPSAGSRCPRSGRCWSGGRGSEGFSLASSGKRALKTN